MNDYINDSVNQIKNLEVNEKIAVLEDIWDSIASTNEVLPITDDQKKILDSRADNYFKNPANIKSWEEAKEKVIINL